VNCGIPGCDHCRTCARSCNLHAHPVKGASVPPETPGKTHCKVFLRLPNKCSRFPNGSVAAPLSDPGCLGGVPGGPRAPRPVPQRPARPEPRVRGRRRPPTAPTTSLGPVRVDVPDVGRQATVPAGVGARWEVGSIELGPQVVQDVGCLTRPVALRPRSEDDLGVTVVVQIGHDYFARKSS
jgi:hypothetical protein